MKAIIGDKKICFSVVCGLFIFTILMSRPWPQAFRISSDLAQEIVLSFKRVDGTQINNTYKFDKERKEYSFYSLIPIQLNSSLSKSKIVINGHQYETMKQVPIKFSSWPSSRLTRVPFFSMLFSSIVFSLVAYILFSSLKVVLLQFGFFDYFSLATIMGLIFALFQFTKPGIILFDTYVNFESAASFRMSTFVGVAYSAILVSLYQLFPSSSLVHWLNFFIISLVIVSVYIDSCSSGKRKFFWLGFCLLFSYPANGNFIISSNRDVSAMFILAMLMFVLMKHRLEPLRITKSIAFWFCLALSCSLRQEFLYITILTLPVLIILKWKKIFLGASLIVVILSVTNHFSFSDGEKDAYQATAIVNPLSYIIHKKYKNLPEDINEGLGRYFRNNYLVEYYNEYEIDPFHRGGVNHQSSHEDYLQFRSKTVSLILENLDLFFENRIKFFLSLFGFSSQKPALNIFTHNSENPILYQMTERIGLESDFVHSDSKIFKYLGLRIMNDPLWTMSYALPFLILIGLFFSFDKCYFFVLALLSIRTAVVVLTAPGAMYKYNFILWVFACFCPIYIRRKATSSMTDSSSS